MNVEGKKNTITIKDKIPKWEAELWSLLSSGDGEHCPLYYSCQSGKKCEWCLGDHIEEVTQINECRRLNIDRCDFIQAEGAGPSEPFRLVEILAGKYLERGKIPAPPTPAELISLFDVGCAIEIRAIPLKSCHGAIWRLDDRWIIQLNNGDTPVERRYTLFHEAFHILAHCRGIPLFEKKEGESRCFNEGLADFFAACILMPRQWINEKWAEVKDIDRMAKIFDVTGVAMWVRLRRLNLI